jgi:hypothetical protein
MRQDIEFWMRKVPKVVQAAIWIDQGRWRLVSRSQPITKGESTHDRARVPKPAGVDAERLVSEAAKPEEAARGKGRTHEL